MRIIKMRDLLLNQQWFQKEVTEKNEKITKTRKKNPQKRRHESLKFKGPTKQQKGLNIRIRMEDPSTSL